MPSVRGLPGTAARAHVLVDCPSLAELRARHLEPPYTLRVVLGEGCDVGGLFRFLGEADILGKV